MQSKIRSLASDTVVYGVSTVIGRFLTFFLTPLYTNYLSASEIGDVTAIYSMIALVAIVYSLGFEPAFMRFWEREDEASNRSVFTIAFFAVSGLTLIATTVVLVLAPYIAQSSVLQLDGDGASIVRIAAFIALFDALVLIPFARLRMQRRPRVFALMRLVAIVVNVTLNILFLVVWDMHVYGVVWAGVIGGGVSFALFLPTIRDLAFKSFGSLKELALRMMRFGLPTVPSSFSSIMVQVIDRPLLLMLTTSATVGLYQTNFRLALPLMMFVTVFEYAWRPFYLHHRDDADAKLTFARVLTLFTVVCGGIFLITALFMPFVVQLPFIGGRFINPAYWSGLGIIPIVMLAYYFNGVFINLAAGLHIAMKTVWLPVATGVAAALNVVVTIALVPVLDIEGAAWAKVVAYAGSVLVLLFFVRKLYPVKYDVMRIALTLITCASLFFINTQLPEGNTRLLYAFVSIPAYIAILLLLRVIGSSTLRTLTGLFRR